MAGEANETIGALASAAQHIDEVVGFIRTSPARPTCWRSMPRIEAARAGEPDGALRWWLRSQGARHSDREGHRGNLLSRCRGARSRQARRGQRPAPSPPSMSDIDSFTASIAARHEFSRITAAIEISKIIRQAAGRHRRASRNALRAPPRRARKYNRSADRCWHRPRRYRGRLRKLRSSGRSFPGQRRGLKLRRHRPPPAGAHFSARLIHRFLRATSTWPLCGSIRRAMTDASPSHTIFLSVSGKTIYIANSPRRGPLGRKIVRIAVIGGPRGPLLQLSLEEAPPGRAYRSVRTERRRCHLGLWRGVLEQALEFLRVRRPGYGRCDRAEDGELGRTSRSICAAKASDRWR